MYRAYLSFFVLAGASQIAAGQGNATNAPTTSNALLPETTLDTVQAHSPSQVLSPLERAIQELTTQHGAAARRAFAEKTRAEVLAGNFDGIEKAAELLRRTPFVCFADGAAALEQLYAGLSPDDHELATDADWEQWQSIYARWAEAVSDSPTLPLARADALINLAWKSRGVRYANTVSEDGWDGFTRSLAQAEKELLASTSNCPHRAALLQTVAMGQNWPGDRYEPLFEAAVAAHPTYPVYYQRKSIYLLPRWQGATGDLAAWAKRETALDRLGNGKATYARIAFFAMDYIGEDMEELFSLLGFTPKELRPSLVELARQYPEANSLTDRGLELVWRMNDQETARTLLSLRRGTRRSDPLSLGELEQIRRWCSPSPTDTVSAWATPDRVVKLGEGRDDWIYNLHLLPNRNEAVAIDLNNNIFIYSIPDLRVVRQTNQPINTRFALSPDGTKAAFGDVTGNLSRITEIDLATLRVLRRIENIPGQMHDLVYTGEASFAASTGGWQLMPTLVTINGQGEIKTTDWIRQEKTHMPYLSVRLSPDHAPLLAFTQPEGVSLYDLSTGNEMVYLETAVAGRPSDLVFSPDGRSLAVTLDNNGNTPCALALWQGPRWEQKSVAVHTGPACITNRPTWSPDGRTVLTGGDSGGFLVWPTMGGEPRRIGENLKWIDGLVFAEEGRRVITTSRDHTLRSWHVVGDESDHMPLETVLSPGDKSR